MIRFYSTARAICAAPDAIVVHSDGHKSAPDRKYWHEANPEFICDTAEEAEKLRLLIEQRREEREALDRKWELRLAEEVSR